MYTFWGCIYNLCIYKMLYSQIQVNSIQNFDCKFQSSLIMFHVSHMERKSSTSLSGLKEQGQTFH